MTPNEHLRQVLDETKTFTNWPQAARVARELTDRMTGLAYTVKEYLFCADRFCVEVVLLNSDGTRTPRGTLTEDAYEAYVKDRYRVGDGVHYSYVNDVYPGTIRKISKSGHMIWISEDRIAKAEWDESFGPRAKLYETRDVPEAEWKCFTRRADGEYRAKGHTSPVLGPGRHFNRPREI
jgi:hypothetical protein